MKFAIAYCDVCEDESPSEPTIAALVKTLKDLGWFSTASAEICPECLKDDAKRKS